MQRRGFLKKLTASAGLIMAPAIHTTAKTNLAVPQKPGMLNFGDKVAIVSPAGSVVSHSDIEEAMNSIRSMGLRPVAGENLGARWGYLGGRDSERLTDLHDAFENPEIKAVMPIRGGYGSSRILPMVDFDLIRRNPKAFIGFSDNTSLVLTINQMSNLVTFYGPNAFHDWTHYTRENYRNMLMSDRAVGNLHPPFRNTGLRRPVNTLVHGRARGRLTGGNLSLLVQTLGTEWEIDTRGKILFFEDVNESPYRIDRMLTHLWLARKLQDAAGFAIGDISVIRDRSDDLDLITVLRDRFEPLGKPCYLGFSTGHIPDILTVPLGADVEMDATNGVVRVLEGVVV